MLLQFAILAVGLMVGDQFDLTQTSRAIGQQPTYLTPPKYCLMVFGPQARTQVWLAKDGNKLYVDRNGNADLADDGPPVNAEVDESIPGFSTFLIGDIVDETNVHKGLKLSVDDDQYQLSGDIVLPGLTGVGVGGRVLHLTDQSMEFSDSPRDAPIVHFGGPLQISMSSDPHLTVGRTSDMSLSVGTPGLGRNTMAFVQYDELIPEDVSPQVEIEFPPRRDGDAPIHIRFELKDRC